MLKLLAALAISGIAMTLTIFSSVIVAMMLMSGSAQAGPLEIKGFAPGQDFSVEAVKSVMEQDTRCQVDSCTGGLKLLTFEVMATVKATNGKIRDVGFRFMPHRYQEIRAAMTEKFGKPKETSLPMQNAFGAQVLNHVATWTDGASTLELMEYVEMQAGTAHLAATEAPRKSAGL